MNRKCNKCLKNKELGEFHKDKNNKKYGVYSICKKCKNECNKKIRNTQGFKDKIRDYRRKYSAKFRSENLEKQRIYHREYQKKYRKTSKSIKYYRDYHLKRYNNDINIRLYHNISCALRDCIHKKYNTSKYLKIFGYNIDSLKKHLETNFKEGMTWENYGVNGWHIDHIKPKSLFDCSNEKELIDCWKLENLQPLWAIENIRKKNKYDK